jgi:predicted Zn-ribbon and HTH transcriptional regulator
MTDYDALMRRLREWAQNEEMIDQHFTRHGKDCNEASDAIRLLKNIAHCKDCGASWYDDGNNGVCCPHCQISDLRAERDALRERLRYVCSVIQVMGAFKTAPTPSSQHRRSHASA